MLKYMYTLIFCVFSLFLLNSYAFESYEEVQQYESMIFTLEE